MKDILYGIHLIGWFFFFGIPGLILCGVGGLLTTIGEFWGSIGDDL